MLKKINKKGFTLVELLAVIVVIALILGVVAYSGINAYKASKNKTLALNKQSVVEAARIFANEDVAADRIWHKDDNNEDYEYFCTTIQELKNYGLLNKDTNAGGLDAGSFIYVGRNINTNTIDIAEIVSYNNEEDVENNSRVKACSMKYGTYTIRYCIDGSCKDYPLGTYSEGENVNIHLKKFDEVKNDLKINKKYKFEKWKDGSGNTHDEDTDYPTFEASPGDQTIIFDAVVTEIHKTYIYYLADKDDMLEHTKYTLVESGPSGFSNYSDKYKWIKNSSGKYVIQTRSSDDSDTKKDLYDYNYKNYIYLVKGDDPTRGAKEGQEWLLKDLCVDNGSSIECEKKPKNGNNSYNQAIDYDYDDLCASYDHDCHLILRINWKDKETPTSGKVTIKYAVDDGSSITPLTIDNNGIKRYWRNINNCTECNGNYKYIEKSADNVNSDFKPLEMKVAFNKTLKNVEMDGITESNYTKGLYNYNNGKYLEIKKDGYYINAWKCVSGNCKYNEYNQTDTYSAEDFCNASSGDCTVVLAPKFVHVDRDPSITADLYCGNTKLESNYYSKSENFSSGLTWINKDKCSGNLVIKYTFSGDNLQSTASYETNYRGTKETDTDLKEIAYSTTLPTSSGYYTPGEFGEGVRYAHARLCNNSGSCAHSYMWFKYDKTPVEIHFDSTSANGNFAYSPSTISNVRWVNTNQSLNWKVTETLSGINTVKVYHNGTGQTTADNSKDTMTGYNIIDTNSARRGTNLIFTDNVSGEGVRGTYLYVEDEAGNKTRSAANVYVKIDKTAPVINSFTGNIDGTNYNDNSIYFKGSSSNLTWFNKTPTLTWNTSDALSGVNTSAYYQTNKTNLTSDDGKVKDTHWGLTGSVSSGQTVFKTLNNTFGDGVRRVEFTVSDLAGNKTTKTIVFKKDTVKPSVHFSGVFDTTGNEITGNWTYDKSNLSNRSWNNKVPVPAWYSTDDLSGVKTKATLYYNAWDKSTVDSNATYSEELKGNVQEDNRVVFGRKLFAGGIRYFKLRVEDEAGNFRIHDGVYIKYGVQRSCTFTNSIVSSDNKTLSCIGFGSSAGCKITSPSLSNVSNKTKIGWINKDNNSLWEEKTELYVSSSTCQYNAKYEDKNTPSSEAKCYVCNGTYYWSVDKPSCPTSFCMCSVLDSITSSYDCRPNDSCVEKDVCSGSTGCCEGQRACVHVNKDCSESPYCDGSCSTNTSTGGNSGGNTGGNSSGDSNDGGGGGGGCGPCGSCGISRCDMEY